MASLAQRVQEGKTSPKLQGIMNPWRAARARSLFHETYHWGTTVSRPRCNRQPEIYQPKDVVDLATNENTKEAKINAESWTQAAMAMYLQQTFGLKSPPVPKEYAPADVQSDLSVMGIDNGDLEETFLDQMPDWFAPPVAQGAPAFTPDMTDVVQLSWLSVDGTQTTGTNEPTPTPTPAPAPPNVSSSARQTCDCNENGCTPESPPCCLNGTCENAIYLNDDDDVS